MKIVTSHLIKKYGQNVVLNDVNLTLDEGKFIGIIGPNGSGKSTLMNVITAQTNADKGTVHWEEYGQPLTMKQRANHLGFVHQTSVLDQYLTVKENLLYRGAIHGLKKQAILDRIAELNQDIDIQNILNVRYARLSGGQKRRVDLVAALLHQPQLLILDEPTTGIDPEIRADLWRIIKLIRQKNHITVILISHYLEEMRDVDKLIVLIKGIIQYQGTIQQFINQHSQNTILFEFKNASNPKKQIYQNLNEKIHYINVAFATNKLIDFKDVPVSLEQAYLNMIHDTKVKQVGDSHVQPH